MSYSQEVISKINKLKREIESCSETEPLKALDLQIKLLECLKSTLEDEDFKKDVIRNVNTAN